MIRTITFTFTTTTKRITMRLPLRAVGKVD